MHNTKRYPLAASNMYVLQQEADLNTYYYRGSTLRLTELWYIVVDSEGNLIQMPFPLPPRNSIVHAL